MPSRRAWICLMNHRLIIASFLSLPRFRFNTKRRSLRVFLVVPELRKRTHLDDVLSQVNRVWFDLVAVANSSPSMKNPSSETYYWWFGSMWSKRMKGPGMHFRVWLRKSYCVVLHDRLRALLAKMGFDWFLSVGNPSTMDLRESNLSQRIVVTQCVCVCVVCVSLRDTDGRIGIIKHQPLLSLLIQFTFFFLKYDKGI